MSKKDNAFLRLVKHGLGLNRGKERIFEVDLLRFIPIILVLLYHFCFDIYAMSFLFSNYSQAMINHPVLKDFSNFCESILFNDVIDKVLVPLFGGMFLFACGVSTALSRNNLKRGLILTIGAMLVSLVTMLITTIGQIFDPSFDVFIGWGVLHLMAFSILLYVAIDWLSLRIFKKEAPAILYFAIGALVLYIGILFRSGYTTSNGLEVSWPMYYVYGGPVNEFNQNHYSFFLSAIGYLGNAIDWWPILPFMGVVYVGIAFGKIIYGEKKESIIPFAKGKWTLPITFVGSHTLIIYLGHQIIFLPIILLIYVFMGFRF